MYSVLLEFHILQPEVLLIYRDNVHCMPKILNKF